jgi:hypothetical protein
VCTERLKRGRSAASGIGVSGCLTSASFSLRDTFFFSARGVVGSSAPASWLRSLRCERRGARANAFVRWRQLSAARARTCLLGGRVVLPRGGVGGRDGGGGNRRCRRHRRRRLARHALQQLKRVRRRRRFNGFLHFARRRRRRAARHCVGSLSTNGRQRAAAHEIATSRTIQSCCKKRIVKRRNRGATSSAIWIARYSIKRGNLGLTRVSKQTTETTQHRNLAPIYLGNRSQRVDTSPNQLASALQKERKINKSFASLTTSPRHHVTTASSQDCRLPACQIEI